MSVHKLTNKCTQTLKLPIVHVTKPRFTLLLLIEFSPEIEDKLEILEKQSA